MWSPDVREYMTCPNYTQKINATIEQQKAWAQQTFLKLAVS